MENASHPTALLLAGFQEMGPVKYVCFCLTLAAYLSVVLANSLLVALVRAERSLHEPMYLLLVLLGTTGKSVAEHKPRAASLVPRDASSSLEEAQDKTQTPCEGEAPMSPESLVSMF
ncbi:olfactory receptor 142-like [Arapaima gigas]